MKQENNINNCFFDSLLQTQHCTMPIYLKTWMADIMFAIKERVGDRRRLPKSESKDKSRRYFKKFDLLFVGVYQKV